MRSEKEMFALIKNIARQDERIRAVYMNGSRTNPAVPRDLFQDYDIVYVVTETQSFLRDSGWISVFGDLLILQEPDQNDKSIGMEMDFSRTYAYLMLFTDGNRMDLRLQTKEALSEYGKDSLTVPLLDKDGCLPVISAASDRDYHVKQPTEAEFFSCCNDFWWCLQNVGKGIWREELPYAQGMLAYAIRPRLHQVISWWIGMRHEFSVSPGKMGKYFRSYLPEQYWLQYERTYAGSSDEELWEALFVICDLFRSLAQVLAEELSFTYPAADDANMTAYLQKVRELPKNALHL